ncbi:MAG TPA: hypothetical protein VJT49_28660 [Amycolatopsis sp.]|uniref:hypothetical protein n=1 Tax=Amycolatopsis sp. TaxID=37632 RepID=UPI002B475176|nr:hypothetical protein [Amycolatopsis sp.]HKS49010.1 hypothetical protein [Amycolatopsis sp.]
MVRAAQLQRWAAGEEYRANLAGDYPRREGDKPHTNWTADVRSAAQSHKESFATSADPPGYGAGPRMTAIRTNRPPG